MTRWFIQNGRGNYLTIGAIHSRLFHSDFVEDHTRDTAESFDHYHHARDMIAWLGLTDVRIVDYAPIGEAPKPYVPDHVPTTKELFARALLEDRPKVLERMRKVFEVKHQ